MSKLTEAQFTTRFKQWFKENKPHSTTVYEFKKTDTGVFSLKHWRTHSQAHQESELINSSTDVGTYKKISDESSDIKPYDAFYISNAEAYLVIWFNKFQVFFMIPVEELPDTVSVSYKYLSETYIAHKLIAKKKIEYEIF